MKKTLTLLLVTVFFFLGAHSAFAAGCTTDDDCDGALACINSTCQVDPNLDPAPTGTTPGTTAGTPASPSTTPGATTPAGGSGYTNTSNFTPLTALPGLKSITQSGQDFSGFFNSLYKICVGVAAALAVLQIIRAGVLWMSAGDSSEKVSQARGIIATSIYGLILVLAPVIIFSIINPNILSLQLNVGGLSTGTTPSGTTSASSTPTPNNPGASTIPNTGQTNAACKSMPDGTPITGTGSTENQQAQCCTNQTGVSCTVNWNYNVTPASEYCACQ